MASLADGFSAMGHPPPSPRHNISPTPRQERPPTPRFERPPTPVSSPRNPAATMPGPDAQQSEAARLAELAAEAWVGGLIALPPQPPPIRFVRADEVAPPPPPVINLVDDTVVDMPEEVDDEVYSLAPPGEQME